MVLEIKNLTKKYKSQNAVNDISLKLHKGVYGLLGANGAGKTTLMRMICGLSSPTSGNIYYNDEDIDSLGEKYRDILGYLPQKFGYYPEFTAFDFLVYIAILKGLEESAAQKKSDELLKMVDLFDVRKKKIRTFSGGMIQRLGIAQAIINDPELLILDEPTAGLDPKERIRFRNIISKLSTERIVILSTHIVSDVEFIANDILIQKKGKIIMNGTVEELTNEIVNNVWECKIPIEDIDKFSSNFCTSNIRSEEHSAVVRVVSEEKPYSNAINVKPSLEDLYLFNFREE